MHRLQKDIAKWQADTFKSQETISKCTHLKKEVKELRKALLYETGEEIAMEIADCGILLFGIANQLGVDVLDVMAAKLKINKERVWGEPDEDGVICHIKKTGE